MAKIGTGTLKDFKDGEYVHADDFDQAFETVRIALNDADDKASNAAGSLNDVSSRLEAVEFVGNDRNVRHREQFIATEGQTLFTLLNGTYLVDSGLLDVTVSNSATYDGGSINDATIWNSLLYAGHGLTETSSSSFTLDTPVDAGAIVTATYYVANPPLGSPHHASHKKGGADELNIVDLKGYTELNASITSVATDLVTPLAARVTTAETDITTLETDLTTTNTNLLATNEFIESTMRKEIANLQLSLAASNRISAPDLLGTTGLSNQMGISFKNVFKRSTIALMTGTSTVTLDSVDGLVVGEEYTIYDDLTLERVVIQSIDSGTKTVLLNSGVTSTYKIGTRLVKSMYLEHYINGFFISGWVQPNGVTNTIAATTIDNSQGSLGTNSNYFPTNGNNITITDDGTIFTTYHADDLTNINNSKYILRKFSNCGATDNGVYMTVDSGYKDIDVVSQIQAVLYLGGYFIAWLYTKGTDLSATPDSGQYLRIINYMTGEYVDNRLNIPFTAGYKSDFALSPDRKKIYYVYQQAGTTDVTLLNLYTITVQPDMTITLEIDPSIGTTNTVAGTSVMTMNLFRLVVAKGYLALYWVSTATTTSATGLYVSYRPLTGGSWTIPTIVHQYQVTTNYYAFSTFDVLVDSNDVIWIAGTPQSLSKPVIAYSTGTDPATFSAYTQADGAEMFSIQLTETESDILIFGTANVTDNMDIYYIGFNKTTKVPSLTKTLISVSSDATTVYDTQGYRALKYGRNIMTSGYFVMYSTSTGLLNIKATNTGAKYYPLQQCDVRFSLANVKELTLFVQKENNTMSVDGKIGATSATKTQTDTEVTLDWVLPSLEVAPEVRLTFSRSTIDTNKKFARIVGGKTDI